MSIPGVMRGRGGPASAGQRTIGSTAIRGDALLIAAGPGFLAADRAPDLGLLHGYTNYGRSDVSVLTNNGCCHARGPATGCRAVVCRSIRSWFAVVADKHRLIEPCRQRAGAGRG